MIKKLNYSILFVFIFLLTGCKDDQNSVEPIVNQPPTLPSALSPPDKSSEQTVSPELGWTCTEPDNDSLFYDVYFGVEKVPVTLIAGHSTVNKIPLKGLSRNTTYYWKVVAKDKKEAQTAGPVWSFTTISNFSYGSLTYNGFTYRTITIGTQEWTVDNLRSIKYNNGVAIEKMTDVKSWTTYNRAGYCTYNNDESTVQVYGYLYNWFAINTGKMAPAGWRVPTENDWLKLIEYMGDTATAGTKLKSETEWLENRAGTNNFGFNALPGGYRHPDDGTFFGRGYFGIFWSSTRKEYFLSEILNLHFALQKATLTAESWRTGLQVRLVRDL